MFPGTWNKPMNIYTKEVHNFGKEDACFVGKDIYQNNTMFEVDDYFQVIPLNDEEFKVWHQNHEYINNLK